MAKYINVPSLGMFTYALDECEDYLVLDAYLYIRESGRFEKTKHINVFEYYHLQEGGTLNDNILMQLNGCLRNLGRPSLAFVNGHTTNFAALRGQEKVLRRQTMLDHIHSLHPAQRADLIAQKETEAARLPERNADLPNRAPPSSGGLSRAETERRRVALASAQRAEVSRDIQAENGPAQAPVTAATTSTNEPDGEFIPESTMQDNVVELITEMHDLRTEVASLKMMLQTIFKNV
ncbi:MAG: hypothetical protein JW395_2839 [Nitrospira sp.]|nr:hypothetical protein [Nitrospira sp.]